jgi:hypothetical protein
VQFFGLRLYGTQAWQSAATNITSNSSHQTTHNNNTQHRQQQTTNINTKQQHAIAQTRISWLPSVQDAWHKMRAVSDVDTRNTCGLACRRLVKGDLKGSLVVSLRVVKII